MPVKETWSFPQFVFMGLLFILFYLGFNVTFNTVRVISPLLMSLDTEILLFAFCLLRLRGLLFGEIKRYKSPIRIRISRQVVLWADETSTYSWSRSCTVNCRPFVRNFHLSRTGFRVQTADLRGRGQVCYHCATMAPSYCYSTWSKLGLRSAWFGLIFVQLIRVGHLIHSGP